MYMRLNMFSVGPGNREAVERLADHFAAIFRAQRGFRNVAFFETDPSTGEYGSFSLWDTREDAQAADVAILPQLQQGLQEAGLQVQGTPFRRVGDVYEPILAGREMIQLVREHIEAFNANDMARFGATLADDCVYQEYATNRRIQGRDEVVRVMEEWRRAFPDARGSIASVLASNDRVVMEVIWEGTHQGDLAGPQGVIPASGKQARVPASQIITIEGGKIKEDRHYFDLMTLLQQIGAVPSPAQAGI